MTPAVPSHGDHGRWIGTEPSRGAFAAVLAIGSIGLAAAMKVMGRDKDAQFIGHWVPTILILGLYNKIVKVQGSD